jgi:hypothetical protein
MSVITINVIVGAALLAVGVLGTPTQDTPAVDVGIPVTVTGCLRKWEPAMTRTGVQNPAKLEHVLTNLGPGTPAAPALPNVMRYLVKGKDTNVSLSPHVGQRIEVTGMVTGHRQWIPGASRPRAPTLTVATLKVVSTECHRRVLDR